MSNMMYNTTQSGSGSSMLDTKSQSRPEHSTGFSGRDDAGDVRLAGQQWGDQQQMGHNNNIQLVGPGEQNLQGMQGPGTSQEFLAQSQSGDNKDWSGQPSDKWGPNSQQWATKHDDVAGQASMEPHHERMPKMDFGNQSTSEILGMSRDQPVGDAANLGGNQPSLREAQPYLGSATTDLGVGSGQHGSSSEINVPVVTTTTTVTEVREVNVPIETAPKSYEHSMPTEQSFSAPVPTEHFSAPMPTLEQKDLTPLEHLPIPETEKHLSTTIEQQIPVAPPLKEVPVAVPVAQPGVDVFQNAAKKAEDYHARIEEREREKMRIHESREMEHKRLENQLAKEEWKHEKSHKKHLAEQEMHRSLAQHHAEEMERQHERHIKNQERLHRLVVQHTEEMKEAHEAHLRKLENLKNLVLQHTHDMKMEQQEHLAEQQRHHDLIKSHSEQVEKHQLEAEKEIAEAEAAREKKEREQRMKEAERERKEVHQEVKEEARVMPGGSGVLGGLKDAAHKAKVAIGL